MFRSVKKFITDVSYRKFFFVDEIENSKILQTLFYVINLSFFVTFYSWDNSKIISISSVIKGFNICPPYFQSCGNYYFLESLPYGYTQGFFYIILFLILSYGVLSAIKRDWETAHKALLVTFIWKIIFIFVLTYGAGGNFDYYDLCLAFVVLFLKQKEHFAKVLFVTFYFAASTIKIDEGWIFGNYLNTTILGAPFISEKLLPFFSNIVIIMQMIGGWFLLSKNEKLQKPAFIYFFLFHVYSGIIVNYRYITISLTSLVILFGYNFKALRIDTPKFLSILPITRKTIFGYMLLLTLLLMQSIAVLIPGDQKMTLEGNYYGLYMFEANHQCEAKTIIQYKNGKVQTIEKNSRVANSRCDPYRYWYPLKQLCRNDSTISKISWTFDHSINGNKYQRIVNEDNICKLEYKTLGHNSWIKIDGEAQTLEKEVYKDGYGTSIYKETYTIPATPIKNDLITLFKKIYWFIWLATLIYITFILIKKKK
jgi:hypothetical protein